MYVICFYWQGDRWQENGFKLPSGHTNHLQYHMDRAGQIDHHLPSRYVNNLYYGVKRFADRSFKFVCFTNEKLDLDKNIEIRPLPMNTISGVLPRMYMFSEEAGLFGHQVLCIDIDVVIVGSLSKIMSYEGVFCSRSDFGRDRKPDGDIMSFKACKATELIFWKPFIKDIKAAEELTLGRERFWIWNCVKDHNWSLFDDIAPKSIISYKLQKVIRTGKFPKETSVISCHGVPRPHQIVERSSRLRNCQWVKDYWI